MAKIIKEGEENRESILDKISNFLKSFKTTSAVKADDEEPEAKKDEEETEAKVDDSETEAKETDDDGKEAKEDDDAETKAEESDDDDDKDTDDNDNEDDDEMDVNGKTVNLKDPAAVRAAIEELQGINAQQNELLIEAAAELGKTKQEVKNEIKSTFTPPSSKRAHQMGAKEDEQVIPDGLMPKEGSIAHTAVVDALARQKAKNNKK